MSSRVLLGFEVGTGEPVHVPLAHMIATGQTQAAGKTTAFQGLVSRAGRSAVAFRTKRGEGAFDGWRSIPPFFRERCDWQFVESVIGAVLRQGMKFERAWIIKATRNCDTLTEVRRKARNLMNAAKRGFDRDIFMLLGEYLDLVLPVLEKIPRQAYPAIEGLSLMDLSAFRLEVQMLVVHSTLDWVYNHTENTLVMLPESWEMVPQKRDSPVKSAAIGLARKGLALGNILMVDSQDLAGIDKEIVRQCRVYLLGIQRERNEVKRTLDHIPPGMKKPKMEDLATLGLGQFYACWDDQLVRVYAMPAWATQDEARAAAIAGRVVPKPVDVDWDAFGPARDDSAGGDGVAIRAQDGKGQARVSSGTVRSHPVPTAPLAEQSQEEEIDMTKDQEERFERLLGKLEKVLHDATADKQPGTMEFRDHEVPSAMRALDRTSDDEELLFRRFRDRLMRDPIVLKVLATEKRVEVVAVEQTLTLDGSSVKGRIALLVKEGFFDDGKGPSPVWTEMRRRGYPSKSNGYPPAVANFLQELAEMGFLTVQGKDYVTADGAAKRLRVTQGGTNRVEE